MKICNATGNGICVNCNHVPPKINGYSYGDICRIDAEEVLSALERGCIVCYRGFGEFYEKEMYANPEEYMDDPIPYMTQGWIGI